MNDNIITNGGTNRGYKLCKCCKCGKIEKCTMSRDFYTLGDDDTGPLHCEDCFKNHVKKVLNKEPQ